MDRKEQAVELKKSGYNCTQSVLCAFEEELGYSREELMKIGAAFGVGMGTFHTTCGCVIGAGLILGMKTYEGKPILRNAKQLVNAFEEKCGASLCNELKGIESGEVLCSCEDCVRCAVELAEESLA